LQILFGSENDARHIDPRRPGAYEWSYFDALSDDGRYALVAIYFLGTPMSPYYKAVDAGGQPLPVDWCGVFFTLHERIGGRWRERAYAYNLHRESVFSDTAPEIVVGKSGVAFRKDHTAAVWTLAVEEPGLWRGRVRARLKFVAAEPRGPILREGDAQAHAWVCAAPDGLVEGTVTLPTGREIAFRGRGYHDHNFGTLPFADTGIWYWARAHFPAAGPFTSAVVYHRETPPGMGSDQTVLLLYRRGGGPPESPVITIEATEPTRNAYGLRYDRALHWSARGGDLIGSLVLQGDRGALAEGPFYRRLPATMTLESGERQTAEGIGEVFRPARLCGPIASRAMWSRLRRRA
jgi:carotenoid 1,2-hydratase